MNTHEDFMTFQYIREYVHFCIIVERSISICVASSVDLAPEPFIRKSSPDFVPAFRIVRVSETIDAFSLSTKVTVNDRSPVGFR